MRGATRTGEEQAGESKSAQIRELRELPGGPLVKTLPFQHRQHGFHPWSGEIRSHVLQAEAEFSLTHFRKEK